MDDGLTMRQILRREEAQNLVKEVGGVLFLLAAKRQSVPLNLRNLVEDLAAELLRAVDGRQTAESAFVALEWENSSQIDENRRLQAELDGLRAELDALRGSMDQHRQVVASCAALVHQAPLGSKVQAGTSIPRGGLDDIDF